MRVLESGCGGGEFCMLLERAGYGAVVGVDFSETAIELAKANAKQAGRTTLRFVCADALAVPPVEGAPALAPESFDLITSLEVLHCFIGADRHRYFRAVHTLSKPGGVLALACMVDLPNTEALRARVDPKTRIDDRQHRYFAAEAEIVSEAEAAGFEVLHRERAPDPEGCDDFWLVARRRSLSPTPRSTPT